MSANDEKGEKEHRTSLAEAIVKKYKEELMKATTQSARLSLLESEWAFLQMEIEKLILTKGDDVQWLFEDYIKRLILHRNRDIEIQVPENLEPKDAYEKLFTSFMSSKGFIEKVRRKFPDKKDQDVYVEMEIYYILVTAGEAVLSAYHLILDKSI